MAVDTPIVDNVSAADVGASYAVVGGEVVRSGDETPIITLYWGDNDGGLDAASWDQSVSLGAQNGQFSLTIDSLAPQTAYYYRAFAENSFGSDWANTTASFFTEAPKTEGAAMYNDHVATGLTHVNVTSYAGDATSSGPLLDFATGQPTGVTLTTTGVRVDEYFNSSAFPTEGTDAAEIFAGAIGFDRGNVGISGNEAYEHLYSGLNPLASYEFAGTAIRGNDAYTNRWTLVTLEGAESFTPAHSAGDGVVTDGLAANQAAVWVGGNQDPGEGFVVRWTDIDPGTDGEFEIVSTQYTGAIPTSIHPGGFADGARAYAMAATRLVESVAGLAVLNADPSPGDALSASPTTMTIDFNLPVEAATLDAGDLTVNGVAASSATLIDEDTAEWSLPAGVIAGDYLLNVSPGAIQSTLGDPFLGYSAPFSVAAPPAVENAAAADVLSTTAAIGVDVLADGFDPPTVLLHWGDSDQGTDSAAWQNVVDLGRIDQGVVSIDLANLPQNTPHYYRAMASNAAGEVWASETASFSTLSAELPMVVNGSAANLSAFSADVSGEVVDTGDDVPSITVHYGTVDGGDDAAAWQQSVDVGLRSGPFVVSLTGLSAETQYFYRARATNAAGSSWANASSSFVTADLPPLVINEIAGGDSDLLATRLRENASSPFSGVETTPDWIEIHNPTNGPAGLGGFHLTDDADEPLKWSFPSDAVVPANDFLVVFASGENVVDSDLDESGRFHTNFELNNGGEYLALTDSAGEVVFEYAPEFPRLREGFTFGRDAQGEPAFFSEATPEAVNNDGSIVAGFVKDTRFSADRGFYDAPIVVEITTDTPGATIAYTTDGSEPTLSNGLQVAAPNASTPPTASVNVSTTTVLRARAYLAGWVETNVDTQTYLYLDDVVDQPASPSGFPSSWGGAPAVDYAMDPQVVNDPAYSQDLIDGLREIPTLSIVTPVEDLFGSGGLYSNTTDSNLEVVASAEWIEGDGSTGFQVDAGFKLQGGASRNPNNSPKHALSLRFRDSIADGKLEFPVYEDSPVTTFDSLHLRARYNNSWIHWSQQQRDSGTMIRDQWIRDSLLDMGQIDAGQGKYVHLYLNGLYWGLYVVEERAEAAHYAQYHGGDESEYDALNGSNVVDGDRRSFDSMKATVRSRDWNAIQQVLDVDNFIDFTIIQQFGSNNDIKTFQNWRGAGGGSANAPWRFYSWDSERVLEGVGEGVSNTTDPAEILNDLMQITEFRVRFADRVQQHFFNGGALTPESATQRLLERTDQLANAIVAESARWGDYRRDVHQRNCGCSLYTRDDHWQVEIDRLVEDYLPFRSEFVVDEYRSQGWFPNIDAAAFQIDGAAQHGGVIDAGALLSFDAEADVYYTLDGSDPRAEGGAPVGTRYRPGVDAPVELDSSTEVNARVRSGSTWSALNTTLFAVAPPPGSLAITELHYHPANNPSLPDEDDQEFIEILNVSNETVDLSGVQITQFAANPYVFANGLELAPNEYLVVARSPAAFRSVYGDEVNLAPDGYANRNLSNGGETIALVDGLDNELVRFTYDDAAPWPDSPDGDGPSLEMIDPLSDPSDPAHWRPSAIDGGSPGWSGEVGSGDFDSDGDVDGTDFLAWQRGFGSTTTADDLTAWEAGFGTTSDSATLVASQQQASAVAFSAATTTLEANQTGATSAEVIDLAISFWQSPEAFSNDLPPLSQVRASEIEPSDAARDQRRATYLPPQRDRWGARDPIATMHDDATLSERRSSVDDVFGSAGWSRISRRLTRSID